MTLKIEIPAEIEERLRGHARGFGQDAEAIVADLVVDYVQRKDRVAQFEAWYELHPPPWKKTG